MKTLMVFLSLVLSATCALAQPPSSSPSLKPLKIIPPEFPREFPEALARAYPNGGQVRLLVTVGADGQLKESLLTSYSARPFAEEANAALKEWKFEPARWMNQPITARVEVKVTFEHHGTMVSTTAPEMLISATESRLEIRNAAYRAYGLAELDRVPVLLRSVKPIYPAPLADRGMAGGVTVDFYVDEQGMVRMPSVEREAPLELAEAAVTAIRQWQFEPPLVRGKPVLAHLQQQFNFSRAPGGGI